MNFNWAINWSYETEEVNLSLRILVCRVIFIHIDFKNKRNRHRGESGEREGERERLAGHGNELLCEFATRIIIIYYLFLGEVHLIHFIFKLVMKC